MRTTASDAPVTTGNYIDGVARPADGDGLTRCIIRRALTSWSVMLPCRLPVMSMWQCARHMPPIRLVTDKLCRTRGKA